ncbi:MAG: DUF357 domain-containing protein [Thermoprotei archaeon]|nr:MAG: DUF357 domain-containing protein [Thermoprotei archaeon]RLF03588.1 MAG: DUF357 domain-containing protein [Thermoprotei archaeon]
MVFKGKKAKIEEYIKSVEKVLESVEFSKSARKPVVSEIVDLAKAYVNDARYYLEKEDLFTSLACIAYAEGLLDALRFQGLVNFSWERPSRKTVLVGGVFDILHPGHIFFLRQAWDLGRVVIVLARDSTVRKFKGHNPVFPEGLRRKLLESMKYVYKVVLGDEKFDVLKVVEDVKPDVILFGPDQRELMEKVKEVLQKSGKTNVKLLQLSEAFEEELCKTSKIIERIRELGEGS